MENEAPDNSGERVFKKTSPNNKLTLYLVNRDLIVSGDRIDKLQGVFVVDPEYVQNRKVYGQVTLTFRYGREDEEVMGLKFCNEAVMSLAQLYPSPTADSCNPPTPLQEALMRRLGPQAQPFTLELTPLAPPSVQLVPAKQYNGAPIGTSYDIRVYVADRPDEKLHRRSSVRMGIRVLQRPAPSGSSQTTKDEGKGGGGCDVDEGPEDNWGPPPHASASKPFLLSDGKVELEASLDRASYCHGDPVQVHVAVANNSNKTVRRIKVFVVQHVDVCMFSNGKFKNVVATASSGVECPVGPGSALRRSYELQPARGATKNWIALEDSFSRTGAALAATVLSPGPGSPAERNVFAIYVDYYVKVKLAISTMGGELSVKLPFTLVHASNSTVPSGSGSGGGVERTLSPLKQQQQQQLEQDTTALPPAKKEKRKKAFTKEDEDVIAHCVESDLTT